MELPAEEPTRLTILGGITQAEHSGHCTDDWAEVFGAASISRQAGQEKLSITSAVGVLSPDFNAPEARGRTSIFLTSSNRSSEEEGWEEKGLGRPDDIERL